MDYDFFDEEVGEKTPQNATQRNPAPSVLNGNGGMAPQKKGGSIRWWHILTAICIALFFSFGGYVLCYTSFDMEMHTLRSLKKQIQQGYYEEITDEQFYDALFSAINEDLLDEYSGYMTSAEYLETLRDGQGSRQGVGLVFEGGKEDELRIFRVSSNSPAEAAGIKAGEKILSCGATEDTLTDCTTFEQFSAILNDFDEGETLVLRLQSGETTRNVVVSRQSYVENYVFYRTRDKSYGFTGEKAATMTEQGEPLAYLDADTAYIQLLQFSGNAEEGFKQAMTKFKEEGKKHLVLDLRGNPGGYLDVMQSIASYFCKTATEEKPIVAIADYGEYKVNFRATGNVYDEYFAEDSRIQVLADNHTASAAECLLGVMVDYDAIDYEDICLVARDGGTAKTFGKGIMQETRLVSLLQMDALKLTTATIYWPNGRSIHKKGVLPADGARQMEENADFALETQAAIAALNS